MVDNKKFNFTFDINTIDHLGAKLYSTIPPMLAELISNAWDADAKNVYIELKNGDNKSITVKDDGFGMSFDDLNNKFLKIGRNCRLDLKTDKTINGRPILGKKGLGKLSMFGIGKNITIISVKDGLKNAFVMDYDDIQNSSNPTYEPKVICIDQKVEKDNGTIIKIEKIGRKSDFDDSAIEQNIRNRFHIFSDDFKVYIGDNIIINNNILPSEDFQFQWEFPKDFLNDIEKSLLDFAKEKRVVGKIMTSKTPIKNSLRGIVLFSRNKLVQENRSFDKRANDNFFQYMCGSFDVDFIDEDMKKDNCSTDRKSLAWDSFDNDELVKLNDLLENIVKISQNKWRKSRKEIKANKIKEKGKDIEKWILSLNSAEKPLARKIINSILENDNITEEQTETFICDIKDMYSFQSFKDFAQKLSEMEQLDNESAIKLLFDWQEIEAKEHAKIAIGRLETIDQFEKYIKSNASERDILQKFFEEFPWLLDPKMARFEREVTYTKLLKEKFHDETFLPISNRRIDFLCSNSSGIIHIIELKRPNIKITQKEIMQIAEYVEFIKTRMPQSADNIKGILISDNMNYDPGVETVIDGLKNKNIYVKSYSDLLAEARRYNNELYDIHENIAKFRNDN